MWKTCDSAFNLTRHLLPFMQTNPFYAEVSRRVHKRFTTDIPTMAVTYDFKDDELVMWVNPFFLEGGTYEGRNKEPITCEPLQNSEIAGCIMHEFSHIIFGHLNVRRREPAHEWNIATDLAINSLIEMHSGQGSTTGEAPRIPRMGLVPGRRPYVDLDKINQLPAWQRQAHFHLSNLIESLPHGKASEWYFNKVLEDAKKNGYGSGDVEFIIESMDDHSGWDEVPPEMQEYVQGKVRALVEKAVHHADARSNGWGNIPVELRDEIRRSVSNVINWRNVLRQFVGMLSRCHHSPSSTRINKRYPYIYPGTKRGHAAKLLVAIDESGSVDDGMLEMFFAELEQLTKRVDVTLLHFDCSCDEADVYEWKKGTRPKLQRMRGGGTNFDAPTNLVNDPKNRGRWDGWLCMTDGCAPAPGPSRLKRGWILGQGCKLAFPSEEIQISMNKERVNHGAWR